MKKRESFLIILPFLIIAVALGTSFLWYPSRNVTPPGWDETHISFSSDEDMASYCGCLFFDTSGLDVSSVTRSLAFDSPQDKDEKNWSCLEAAYFISNYGERSSMFTMRVFPKELSETDAFPVQGRDVNDADINGVQVKYQEFEDEPYSFRALFVHDGYTYETDISSPTNPDILTEYLQRLIPAPFSA